jgi:mannose-6-phosphate isomerase-like protein (cupin superfamily)
MRLIMPVVGFALTMTVGLSLVSAQQASPPQGPAAAGPAQGRAAGAGRGPGGGAARGGGPQIVWSPKAAAPPEWTPPHKPHTKLADLLAAHAGRADWVETIVDDETLHAAYISMGPGKATPRRMNADTREWWVIQDGQIRFTIDGQEPFVASKGYIVQVPYRTFYTMETVGGTPSLRFEVNIARAQKMYPVADTPVPVPGMEYVRARVAGRGSYDGGNKPWVDFNAVVAGTDKTRQFVVDARGFANIILGRGGPPPNPADKGHFHHESAEFWFILIGQIRYTIEGLPTFIADQGDIVYVPKQRWHLASFAGDGPSARLAMNGYPDLAHSFEALETGR